MSNVIMYPGCGDHLAEPAAELGVGGAGGHVIGGVDTRLVPADRANGIHTPSLPDHCQDPASPPPKCALHCGREPTARLQGFRGSGPEVVADVNRDTPVRTFVRSLQH